MEVISTSISQMEPTRLQTGFVTSEERRRYGNNSLAGQEKRDTRNNAGDLERYFTFKNFHAKIDLSFFHRSL
jgi:hypothetical protein